MNDTTRKGSRHVLILYILTCIQLPFVLILLHQNSQQKMKLATSNITAKKLQVEEIQVGGSNPRISLGNQEGYLEMVVNSRKQPKLTMQTILEDETSQINITLQNHPRMTLWKSSTSEDTGKRYDSSVKLLAKEERAGIGTMVRWDPNEHDGTSMGPSIDLHLVRNSQNDESHRYEPIYRLPEIEKVLQTTD